MKDTIHYVLILDQSGSMAQLKQEVILSFNEQVDMILKLVTKASAYNEIHKNMLSQV